MNSRTSVIILVLSVFFTPACDENSPSGPTVPLARQFTLAPGQAALVEDTAVAVEFLRVVSDSRCPANAICIQAGDAIVRLRVTGGGTMEHELYTNDRTRAVVTHDAVRIELVRLEPYPFGSSAIEPASYQATFIVTR